MDDLIWRVDITNKIWTAKKYGCCFHVIFDNNKTWACMDDLDHYRIKDQQVYNTTAGKRYCQNWANDPKILEAFKKKALSKLTEEEKEVLGLSSQLKLKVE